MAQKEAERGAWSFRPEIYKPGGKEEGEGGGCGGGEAVSEKLYKDAEAHEYRL